VPQASASGAISVAMVPKVLASTGVSIITAVEGVLGGGLGFRAYGLWHSVWRYATGLIA
jgi:hypothetical protein